MDPVKQTRKEDHSEDDSCSYSHESWQEQNICCPYMNNCPVMFQSMPMNQMPMEQMPMHQMPMNQMPMSQMHCCPMPYGESKCNREDDELEDEMRSPRPKHGDYHHDYGHHYPPYWYYPRPPYYKRPRPWWMY